MKAIIDGLVDAKVIVDDRQGMLARTRYLPVVVDGWDGLEITVTEVLPDA